MVNVRYLFDDKTVLFQRRGWTEVWQNYPVDGDVALGNASRVGAFDYSCVTDCRLHVF